MQPAKARYDYTGRVAVVTGGANGIGAEIVRQLRAHGARVAVWDLRPAAPDPHACVVDVTDRASVARARADTLARLGGVHMLVNSAGYAGPTAPVDRYDPQAWDAIVQVNLTGTFNVCREVVPHMRAAGAGRIVNIASLAGQEGTPDAAAYSAAKAGVLALTKSLGKELALTGVRVNAVAPAAVRTELLAQMSPGHVQTMIAKSPMQRLGEPGEVAELVAWLCSDSCTFNTGAVFDLSGGRATY
ncbi:SDR family NAD(P)-dependent oxidoreductase [Bordetella sp. BOR01]|uniref:SDR family NAD(P)-dependent oxidoreductase n=1 Tax=Bordetella sp. BOR01 TaxID=2854779 RepID=UPI001C46DEFF|nr:SDR family NAD(P)-dependent oxidoreductase [Bordetella sp. BOR01]MBV7484297.1 SDR family oxidoreductase [Bordetella sp. BOR01]